MDTAPDLMLVGEEFRKAVTAYMKEKRLRKMPQGISCFADHNALAESLKENKPQGRTILIKGSHSLKLETIPELL